MFENGYGNDDCETACLGGSVWTALWISGGGRCACSDDCFGLFHVVLPRGDLRFACAGISFWADGGMDWNFRGLDCQSDGFFSAVCTWEADGMMISSKGSFSIRQQFQKGHCFVIDNSIIFY